MEVVVTDSVMEALALENNLIKQRSPKYNILLRDDKNYPYLQLTTGEPFPRVLVARRVEKGADFYAGPFLPAKLARRAMALSHRLFGLRSCNEVITGMRARPCLEYDIKRCIAPCVAEICSEERYGVAVANTRLLLEGRNDELIATLRDRMAEAAESERFEEAAQMRDALRTVQVLRDRQQKVATPELGDRDVFGLKVGPSGSAIQVFAMRGGRVVERVELATDPGGVARKDADVLEAAVQQFYEDRVAPAEINLPLEIDDAEAIEAWLTARAGGGCGLPCPAGATSAPWWNSPPATRSSRTGRSSTRIPPPTSTRSKPCAPRSGCRPSRAASNALTSRPSRAARRWPRWWSAKTGG